MSMPATHRRWTSADVRRLINASRNWPRYELIDGELLVTPSPGHPHQLAVGELHLLIAPYVEREELGLTFLSPSDVELREESITQPDLYVVPDTKRIKATCSLLLAVEVTSPTSVRTDRVTKRDFYMESGVAEYWVLDLDAAMIERWTTGRDTPRVEQNALVWNPDGASTALTLDLRLFFERIRRKSEWMRSRSAGV